MADYESSESILESEGIPMSAPDSTVEMSSPEAQTEQEYEYTARGQKIKEPVSMILKRASQGYDYAQSMFEFNKQKLELEQRYKPYEEINDYASKNQQWWNHVTQSYQNRDTFNQPQARPNSSIPEDLNPVLEPILKDLEDVKSFKAQMLEEKQKAAYEKEDAQLTKDIESIRKDYPGIDFARPDENGKTLEYKVLEHGVQNGIKSFRSAFRDFHHEELVKIARNEGMQSIAKDQQKKTKMGLLGETAAPTKTPAPARSLKSRSYNDLYEEALEEYGIEKQSSRRN